MTDMIASAETQRPRATDTIRVALYSTDRTVRASVCRALGQKVARDLPELEIEEFATHKALMQAMDQGVYDLAILDGEAAPFGGMGLSVQIHDEIPFPPPIVLLVARQQDAWLAAWSRADAVSPHPVDPILLPEIVAEVLRADRSGRELPLSVGSLPEPGGSSQH